MTERYERKLIRRFQIHFVPRCFDKNTGDDFNVHVCNETEREHAFRNSTCNPCSSPGVISGTVYLCVSGPSGPDAVVSLLFAPTMVFTRFLRARETIELLALHHEFREFNRPAILRPCFFACAAHTECLVVSIRGSSPRVYQCIESIHTHTHTLIIYRALLHLE